MSKLKNNINEIMNHLKFSVISILYLFILYYLFEKILAIPIDNIIINIIFYMIFIIIVLVLIRIGFKLILKYFSPFSDFKMKNLNEEERKEFIIGSSLILLIAILINENIPYSKIESNFIKLLFKSCYPILTLFIYVKYINNRFYKH